jgi:hypothetical protein
MVRGESTMKFIKQTLLAAALVSMSSLAFADSFHVTAEKAGNAHVAALDFSNDSNKAVGFEFKLKIPAGATVDTSKMFSELPASHQGAGSYNEAEGYVVGMVFSDSNEALPAGLVRIGTVSAKGKGMKGVPFEVIKFLSADVNGKEIQSSAKVIRDGAPEANAK